MNIAIFVYSHTGNTLSAANRLKEHLEKSGNKVTLASIKAVDENPNVTKVVLTQIPDPKPYDRLILATPVHGFQVPAVMKAYVNQMPVLKDKPVSLFVTHAFPFAWMGGKPAIKMLKDLLAPKQVSVKATAIINSSKKESDIINMLTGFSEESSWS